jgi:Family of unknown function (DUF5343)
MALPEQYLLTVKNLDAFLNSLLNAQAPTKFTIKFLEQLEFKSTNDRLLIGMLKFLGFTDTAGIPQERYFKFLDQTQSKQVLAEAIKEAYSDLFTVNVKANEMTVSDIKNKFKTLTQGQKSDKVLGWMANTFSALCKYADFTKPQQRELIPVKKEPYFPRDQPNQNESQNVPQELINKQITTEMHYNIQIHLPETRDITVYDAIFKSLKEHLL